jgi:hypothetical protein
MFKGNTHCDDPETWVFTHDARNGTRKSQIGRRFFYCEAHHLWFITEGKDDPNDTRWEKLKGTP